jgi:hypothetical protein
VQRVGCIALPCGQCMFLVLCCWHEGQTPLPAHSRPILVRIRHSIFMLSQHQSVLWHPCQPLSLQCLSHISIHLCVDGYRCSGRNRGMRQVPVRIEREHYCFRLHVLKTGSRSEGSLEHSGHRGAPHGRGVGCGTGKSRHNFEND